MNEPLVNRTSAAQMLDPYMVCIETDFLETGNLMLMQLASRCNVGLMLLHVGKLRAKKERETDCLRGIIWNIIESLVSNCDWVVNGCKV